MRVAGLVACFGLMHLLLLAACNSCNTSTGSNSDALDADSDPLAEKLRHCPVTVEGVEVQLRDVEGGVEITVIASSTQGVDEIRRRVKHLEEFTSGKETGVTHGGGKGGGWMRDCSVVTKGTRIVGRDIEQGSKLEVIALDPSGVSELREETRRRHEKLLKTHLQQNSSSSR